MSQNGGELLSWSPSVSAALYSIYIIMFPVYSKGFVVLYTCIDKSYFQFDIVASML